MLFSFLGDGAYPDAGQVMGAAGKLYGTTFLGGTADKGTVFRVPGKTGRLAHPSYRRRGGVFGAGVVVAKQVLPLLQSAGVALA